MQEIVGSRRIDQLRELLIRNFDDKKSLQSAEFIQIYDTKSQHTWLVVSEEYLYCLIDRIKEDNPRVLWQMSKHELIKNEKLAVELVTVEQSDAGNLDVKIDGKSARKFSTSLFTADEMKEEIVKRISSKMCSEPVLL